MTSYDHGVKCVSVAKSFRVAVARSGSWAWKPPARCSMVLECYLHLPLKWPSFVGKYSSTMVRIWAILLLVHHFFSLPLNLSLIR